MMIEQVILVDKANNPIGTAEKLAAHEQNLLHRAFSIFVFRDASHKEVLLQQRALGKYHSPGLWTNTCCSHPRPDETILAAGERRLQEEMGFKVALRDLGWFHYNVHFANGLSEHEIDHVLIGTLSNDELITPNPHEVHATQWINVDLLQDEISQHPDKYTMWLAEALKVAIGSKRI